MTPKDVLLDPGAPPSAVWAALGALLGLGIEVWEPETLQLEVGRLGGSWEALAPKVLAAQTAIVSRVWTYDWDALFAFALACEGQPAAADAFHHPTVLQLAWAVLELQELCGAEIDEHHGFDPDTIDPGVAALLHDDGWVLAPDPLGFCQGHLDRMNRTSETLREHVRAAWTKVRDGEDDSIRRIAEAAPENEVGVQICHLADAWLELRARARRRAVLLNACGR